MLYSIQVVATLLIVGKMREMSSDLGQQIMVIHVIFDCTLREGLIVLRVSPVLS